MTQVVELSGDEKALLQSYDRAIKKQVEFELALRNGGAAGDAAGTQIEDALNKVKRANDQALKGLLGDLKSLGPDGAAAADALKGHFVETGKAGYQSFDKILDQIRAIDPEAANAAAAARNALNEAANSSETQFHDILEEMRALGPEGRKAAEQIKANFVEAGLISEKKVEDIAKAFDKIDPAAAKAAQDVIANMKKGTDTSKDMFVNFGKSAIAEITAIAGAYIGVQEAISQVTEYLEEQRQKVREVTNAHLELAAVQENASKNLAGLGKAERLGLLEQAPAIAMEAGVSTSIITEALGQVASTGLNDPKQIADIVKQNAKLSRLTPEELPSSAAGAADIMNKTGLQDIRQTSALFLTTGAQSLVADPAKLQAALPRALGAGIVSAPKQDKETAARETAAIFAQATNVGTDTMGASSATFTIDLLSRMDQFFSGLDRERVEARSKIELIDRKIEKGKDTELDRLKKKEAEAFLAASEGVKDPGTQFGRLELLQQSEALAKQFTGEKGFGEKQFAPFLKEIMDATSKTSQAIRASKEAIKADIAAFEQQAQELISSTASISIAVLEKEAAAVVDAGKLEKKDKGSLGAIREATFKALEEANTVGLEGWLNSRANFSGTMGRNASEAALEALQYLETRKTLLEADGISKEDARNIAILEKTKEKIFAFIERDVQSGAIDKQSASDVAKQADAMSRDYQLSDRLAGELKQLAKLLERVASSTEATAKTNAEMVAPAQATATNTAASAKTPPITPALGQQQS